MGLFSLAGQPSKAQKQYKEDSDQLTPCLPSIQQESFIGFKLRTIETQGRYDAEI